MLQTKEVKVFCLRAVREILLHELPGSDVRVGYQYFENHFTVFFNESSALLHQQYLLLLVALMSQVPFGDLS
jgi:hypothetical protein